MFEIGDKNENVKDLSFSLSPEKGRKRYLDTKNNAESSGKRKENNMKESGRYMYIYTHRQSKYIYIHI